MPKIQPLSQYNKAKYPTKEDTLTDTNLLLITPNRWKNNLYVMSAFSTIFTITLLTGCTTSSKSSPINGEFTTISQPKTNELISNIKENELTTPQTLIAPLFDYGDGRGSFGCVSVAPPAFLSEEEAYQIIEEEAKQYGIELTSNNKIISNLRIPTTNKYAGEIGESEDGDLTLDGYDMSQNIGFEFVSTDDFVNQHRDIFDENNSTVALSVESYNTKNLAGSIINSLEQGETEGYIGVFYDPMVSMNEEYLKEIYDSKWDSKVVAETNKRHKEENKQQLKEQVKNFLEWLKGQGII